MTNEEEQEENILTKEIEPWNSFEYALREEDRVLFSKMLNECEKENTLKHSTLKENTTLPLNHCLWL
jgi:hypothetical protein